MPTALSGIISGILLALARVMGETAPVLVLVGYSRSINYDMFNGNMASLPLLIYTELTNPLPAGQFRIWGAALTLDSPRRRADPARRPRLAPAGAQELLDRQAYRHVQTHRDQ